MKNGPLVSIALCTYNGAAFLAEQLDSLISQTYGHVEIIAVDDCSTDDTFQILTRYAAKYRHVKVWRNEKNLGFSGNFERAVTLCSAGLIALCDQDDIWHPQKIELQVNAINGNIFIYHDSEFVNEDGTTMNKKMSDVMNLYKGGDPESFIFFNCVSGHSILMKRELLDYALPLKKGYFHDWWLAYTATNIGRIDFIPQCLVKYRQHGNSETNILQLAREKDRYDSSSRQSVEKTLSWLSYCVGFKANKDQKLIDQIYYAYKKRLTKRMSFGLTALLFKHWKTLLYMKKKPPLSKLNYIRKQTFGFRPNRLIS